MYVLLVGWAIAWVLGGPGLMFVGIRGIVCNILSLEWSTDVVLFSKVGGLGRYVLSLVWLLT